jgi:hypothetical protein
MGSQDVGVWIIVASALIFLISRNVNLRRRRKQPAQTFIPLSSLKRTPSPPARDDDGPACH